MPWLLAVAEFSVIAVGLRTVERLLPLDPARTRNRWTDRRSDARWFGVYLPFGVLFGLASGWVVDGLVHGHATRGIGRLPWLAEVAAALVVYDLSAYWLHRVLHRVPWLWRWHSVHHRSVELRWWTTFRVHPGELALTALVPPVAVAGLGAGPGALVAATTAVAVFSLFGHVDAEMPAGGVEHVLAVPPFHRRHHQAGTESRNFAVVFAAFDHLFGTWSGPQPAVRSAQEHPADAQGCGIGDRGELQR